MNEKLKMRFHHMKRYGKSASISRELTQSLISQQYQKRPSLIIVRSFSRQNSRKNELSSQIQAKHRFIPYQKQKSPEIVNDRQPASNSQRHQRYDSLPINEPSISQLIRCKQILKQSSRIHHERWNMITSIEQKMMYQMKRKRNKNRLNTDVKYLSAVKSKSQIKFNDLIHVTKFSPEKQHHRILRKTTNNRQKTNQTRFSFKVKKKTILNKTQISFDKSPLSAKGLIKKKPPINFFINKFNLDDQNDQQIVGWEISDELAQKYV